MKENPPKPNILFLLSDDQGAWAMNCAGTSDLLTPNLDRLAQTGLRFDNFFCSSPVCSPARASILTGTMPSANGFIFQDSEEHNSCKAKPPYCFTWYKRYGVYSIFNCTFADHCCNHILHTQL